jgi:phosphoribosylanthranilate isomerase
VFRTKICGITNAQDADLVRRLGGQAIGLNFYPDSARYIRGTAASPIPAWGGGILRVGVFVNQTQKEIRAAISKWSLGAIQLHGDETPSELAELMDCRRIKAFRLRADHLFAISDFLSRCDALDCLPEAVLVDGWQAKAYGGTGARADWELLAAHPDLFGSLPVILAGGLDPTNVAAAVAAVRPAGVDVASGVESAVGVKDQRKVAEFLAAANRVFGEL